MSLKDRIARNKGKDYRDPDFDEELAEIPADEIEDALLWEAEQKLEENER
jgi:hypothetical protein